MHKRTGIRITAWCSVLVLLILIIYGGLRIMESAVFSDSDQNIVVSKTVVRDGIKYYPRKDICVVMILGVDQEGKVAANEAVNRSRPVDMVTLLIFDEEKQSCNLLCINRDTMVEMPKLNRHGKVTGTQVAQLALSHTFGYGMEDSCVNTRTTISNLLYGLQIDYYLAMTMDAVAVLNDSVGGVTVNVRDDFSAFDPSIKMGQMTLHGRQALNFVQARGGVGDQLAISRVERQKEYMSGFVTSLKQKAEDSSTFVLKTYGEVSDYIVTDMSTNTITRLLDDYSDYELEASYTLQGENILNGEYYEYYPDEEALDELVLKLFYEVKS